MTETADTESDDDVQEHLAGIEDGCGCAEVWEHLSERRARSEHLSDGDDAEHLPDGDDAE